MKVLKIIGFEELHEGLTASRCLAEDGNFSSSSQQRYVKHVETVETVRLCNPALGSRTSLVDKAAVSPLEDDRF